MLNRHIDSLIERHYAPIYMTMFMHHREPQGAMVYKPELP